jgi:PAS domain S-box-containing protein
MNQPESTPIPEETGPVSKHGLEPGFASPQEANINQAQTGPSETGQSETGQSETGQSELERRLRAHTDSLPLAVMEWLPNLIVTAWNPAAERIFGFTAAEAIGRSMMEPLHSPIPGLEAEAVLIELLSSQNGFNSINANRRKDGREIFCEWTNIPIHDVHGQLQSVISLARDVTEEQRARQAMLEGHERYRRLVETIDGVVWEYVEGIGLTYLSPSVEAYLGLKHEVWFATPERWMSRLHPLDRDRVLEVSDQHFRIVAECEQPRSNYAVEYRLFDSKDRVVWVRDLVHVELSDGRVRHSGVMQDITAQKMLELELARSHERHALALQGANDGIWDWGVQQNAISLSDRGFEILGLEPTPNGMVGMDLLRAHLHPDDHDRLLNSYEAHVLGHTATFHIEVRVQRANGEYRWVLVRGVAKVELEADGLLTARHMGGSVTDISHRPEQAALSKLP